MKIKITHCNGCGPVFEKMVDGSIHEVVGFAQGKENGLLGFYVDYEGAEEGMHALIWASECTIVEEEGGAE